jgi:hypothetical protein
VSAFRITFEVGKKKSEDVGFYPVLQALEARIHEQRYELGYNFRDYGKLSLSIINKLNKRRIISVSPEISEIQDSYQLPNFVGSTGRVGGSFTEWMVDNECPRVGVIEKRKVKKQKPEYFLGARGTHFLKAASKSPDISQSFEDLIMLAVLARKIKHLGLVFSSIYKAKDVDCECIATKLAETKKLRGKKFKIYPQKMPVTMGDAYLVNCEGLNIVPDVLASNNPSTISGFTYNELYRMYHYLRYAVQKWIIDSTAGLNFGGIDAYEVSDRTPREFTRALEKLGLLHSLHGTRYICIPDKLLVVLVKYFAETTSLQASPEVKGEGNRGQIRLSQFVKTIKNEFRILLDPDDIYQFLNESFDYKNFGIDLETAKSYFISNYNFFVERLENLGLATIRPDGDVMIKIG